MQDKTINNALLRVRRDAYGRDAESFGHAEALLRLRGVDLAAHVIHRKSMTKRSGNRQMRLAILRSLRTGPKVMQEIARDVHADNPQLDFDAAYKRAGMALARCKADGLVMREGRLWGLV
jgi:predicted ABC-type transport system involved in lysophospholipase L1 biosynthesis ATPase subunit